MKPGTDYIGVAVGVLLVNEQGKIFLTKRGQKATNEVGTWEIPGGKVEFGELLEEAATREMQEEYAVEIELLHQFPAQTHLLPREKQHWVPTCFLAQITRGVPVICEPEKCEAIGWFEVSDLPSPLSVITSLDLESYKRYLSKDEKTEE